MLEALLAGGGDPRGIYYPDSGPGTKWLKKGDTQAGWFGEVNSDDLFTGEQIMGAANFWQGSNATQPTLAGVVWLKFFYKGKVLYVAKYPFKGAIDWNSIYNAGLVYGTRDNGRYPVGAGVYQYIQMNKKEGQRNWGLKPRLLTGVLTDPSPGNTPEELAGGEWAQLVGRVVNLTNGLVLDKWDNVGSIGWLGNTNYQTLTQETAADTLTNCVVRGATTSLIQFTRTTKASTSYYWRPVLELLDPNELNDPSGISFVSVGQVAPSVNNFAPPSDVVKRAHRINSAQWANALPLVSYSIPPDHLRAAKNVTGTFDSPALRAFTITGSYVL